jgi:heme a synthase
VIGFVQYFAGLPVVVVMLHMLGAALVAAAATWLLISVREPAVARTTVGLHPRGQANRRTR